MLNYIHSDRGISVARMCHTLAHQTSSLDKQVLISISRKSEHLRRSVGCIFIPAEFKLAANATNRQNRRVLRSCVRVYSGALSGTPRLPRHGKTLFCPDRGSPYHRESSSVRPADSSGSCSGIRVSITDKRRVNIILPPRPGRCQCVVSHCVRTSPAAQRSQPGLFHLKPAPIVIQMSVDLESRTRTCPPLLSSDGSNLPDSDTRPGSHGPAASAPPAH